MPLHPIIGEPLPTPDHGLCLDHSKSATLKEWTRGDAGFGKKAGEPAYLSRRFEPMQKPAGDPAVLEIRIDVEHVEVTIGLKADEACWAFPKGRYPGAARCQTQGPPLPV